MKSGYRQKLLQTFIVPFGIFLVLVPVSLILGWNFLTLLLFWFIIMPALAYYLPEIVAKTKSHVAESLIGLMIFYCFMILMIYSHYQSDFFIIMIVSCFVNLGTVTLIDLVNKAKSIDNQA